MKAGLADPKIDPARTNGVRRSDAGYPAQQAGPQQHAPLDEGAADAGTAALTGRVAPSSAQHEAPGAHSHDGQHSHSGPQHGQHAALIDARPGADDAWAMPAAAAPNPQKHATM